jgi:outer membrane protein
MKNINEIKRRSGVKMKGYKHMILTLLIGMVAGVLITPNIAAAIVSKVGVVNVEEAIFSHPDYDSKMSSLKAFQKDQESRLDIYRTKEVLTEEDKEAIVNLRIEIDNAVAEKHNELLGPLEDEVYNAVIKVGTESGIEVILDENAVLYGGLPLTAAVINELGGNR